MQAAAILKLERVLYLIIDLKGTFQTNKSLRSSAVHRDTFLEKYKENHPMHSRRRPKTVYKTGLRMADPRPSQ